MPPSTQPAADDKSAEETVRRFAIALFQGDAEQIKRLSIPCDGLNILTADPPPKNEAGSGALLEMMINAPVRRLKAGDTVSLPSAGGRLLKIKVDIIEANDGVATMLVGTLQLPFYAIKIDGKWLVDPRRLISARQAAQRVRDKEKPASEPVQ